MKAIILTIVLITYCTAELHPISHSIVSEIKAKASTWIPMEPEENPFAYMPVEDIKAMLGTKISVTEAIERDLGFAPEKEFDARVKWGSKIHPIRDQGRCGSDWAFAAASAMSDRWAIEGKNITLSAQNLISWVPANIGCKGGFIEIAYFYLNDTGIVDEEWYPYTDAKSILIRSNIFK